MEKETKELIISHLDILIEIERYTGNKYKLHKLLLIKELLENE
jgi:hypothetical protein